MDDLETEINEAFFLECLVERVLYWQKVAKERSMSAEEAVESIAFSICCMIDGSGGNADVSVEGVRQRIHHEEFCELMQDSGLRQRGCMENIDPPCCKCGQRGVRLLRDNRMYCMDCGQE